MKRTRLRIFAIILTCCLLCTTQLSVVAQGNYLGTDEDMSGYIVTDDNDGQNRMHDDFSQESGAESGSNPLIFSITAAEVTSLLASSAGGKCFELSDLSSTAVRIIVRATLSHSLQDVSGIIGNLNEFVSAGVCYYGYSNVYHDYIYISVYSIYPEWGGFGQQIEGSFSIAGTLESNVRYYSYVKNAYPAGYVFGTVDLYYSSTYI